MCCSLHNTDSNRVTPLYIKPLLNMQDKITNAAGLCFVNEQRSDYRISIRPKRIHTQLKTGNIPQEYFSILPRRSILHANHDILLLKLQKLRYQIHLPFKLFLCLLLFLSFFFSPSSFPIFAKVRLFVILLDTDIQTNIIMTRYTLQSVTVQRDLNTFP